MEKDEIKRIADYFKKLREGLLWGDYDDKALEAELEQIQRTITALDDMNLKPKDQWLKTEADRCERGIDEILSRTFSLHRVDDAEYRPFLNKVANDVDRLLIDGQKRMIFEQYSNEYHKELTESINARKQRWQKINKYREKSFKDERLRNSKTEPPKKNWVWYDDSPLRNGDPNWGFWGPPCKKMPTHSVLLRLLPVEEGRRHYTNGIKPKNHQEEVLPKYYLLLTIIHDWLLPSCVPIDKDISQNRLAKQVDIIDVNLEEEGKGIIERALEHVKADPDRKKENPEPLSKNAEIVYEILVPLPPHKAMTAKEILDIVANKHEKYWDEKELYDRVFPQLRPWGLKNKPRIGYWIEKQ